MTGFCPDDCADLALIGNPTGGCPPTALRKRQIARFAFMSCGIILPADFTKASLEPLFKGATPSIFLSSPLANVQVEDPQTEQIVVHDCMPAITDIQSRKITAEDRIAISVPIQAGGVNAFGDYDFWKDKRAKWLRMAFGLVYCNGDFTFLRDGDGNLASATLEAYTGYQKLGSGGAGAGTLEFTKVALTVLGDPLSFAKPDFNLNTLGIQI